MISSPPGIVSLWWFRQTTNNFLGHNLEAGWILKESFEDLQSTLEYYKILFETTEFNVWHSMSEMLNLRNFNLNFNLIYHSLGHTLRHICHITLCTIETNYESPVKKIAILLNLKLQN